MHTDIPGRSDNIVEIFQVNIFSKLKYIVNDVIIWMLFTEYI